MGLPTIDRNRTLTVYSKFDAERENAVQVRNLSYSQMQRMIELRDTNVYDRAQLLRLWEMVIVHIEGLSYTQKQGEFGLCVCGEWAADKLPLRVISDIVQKAGEALVLGDDEKKASGGPSGSANTLASVTAPPAETAAKTPLGGA